MTYALPYCKTCPPVEEWPAKALIYGKCPACGRPNAKAWRLAAARRLAAAPSTTGQPES